MIKRNLTKILCCPKCHSDLKVSKGFLFCQGCKVRFSIIENKPVFLIKQQKAERASYEKCLVRNQPSDFREKIANFIFSFYFPVKGPSVINKLKEQKSKYRLVLNIGGGNKKYGFDHEINLDISQFPNADVVADAHQLPFKDKSFDLVISDAVLEHVKNPTKVLKEIYRVLKRGGRIYSMTPFLQRYHPYPKDYTRWTIDGVEFLFNQFKVIEKGVSAGPWVSFVEFNIQLLRLLFRKKNIFFFPSVLLLLILLAFLRPIFLLIPEKKEHILANGFYFLGEK